jgi:hypothetical protein
MIPKTIVVVLILSAFAAVVADLASAQSTGFKGNGLSGGGGFQGRSFPGRDPYGRGSHARGLGGFGFVDGHDSDSGYPDWYGISSGYDECPLFRQRVMTPDGWRVRMIPVC